MALGLHSVIQEPRSSVSVFDKVARIALELELLSHSESIRKNGLKHVWIAAFPTFRLRVETSNGVNLWEATNDDSDASFIGVEALGLPTRSEFYR